MQIIISHNKGSLNSAWRNCLYEYCRILWNALANKYDLRPKIALPEKGEDVLDFWEMRINPNLYFHHENLYYHVPEIMNSSAKAGETNHG